MTPLKVKSSTSCYWSGWVTLFVLLETANVLGKGSKASTLENKMPDTFDGITDQVNRHKVFSNPLSVGAYLFDEEGFLPEEPLERLKDIHLQMIETIRAVTDYNIKVKYLTTLANSVNKDIRQIRNQLRESGIQNVEDLDKNKVKGDAFMLMLSHAGLVSYAILGFPDIMKILVKNGDFEANVKWVIEFSNRGNITQNAELLNIFELVPMELGLTPKKPNYRNPFDGVKQTVKHGPTKTTKKPRKRSQRGPRLSRGEL